MAHRDGHEPETIIAASVKVEGDFASQGNVHIEGTVEGSLRTERDLRVGERAKITADVSAANATIAGEIRGNLMVAERLELEPTAKIYGDVRTKVLAVAPGAMMNGRLLMGEGSEAGSGRGAAEAVLRAAQKAEAIERVKASAKGEEQEEVEEEPAARAEAPKEKRTINAFFSK